jgi:hypothetical protein
MKGVFAPRIAGTVLLALAASFAQNSSPGAIRWTEGAPNALSEVKNNNKVEGLKTDDVHIFASLADIQETEYNRVWVQIANHGKAPIDFDPQSAVLLKGGKPMHAEVPDKAANSIQKYGETKSQELGSSHCNLMAAPNPTTGSSGGAGCAPSQTELQMSKQVATFSAQQAQWVRDNAVKQKTLAPNEEVQGVIVFKKEKKAADYILRVPVGGQIFEFTFHADNKAPSYS